jgi:hypothetical protein
VELRTKKLLKNSENVGKEAIGIRVELWLKKNGYLVCVHPCTRMATRLLHVQRQGAMDLQERSEGAALRAFDELEEEGRYVAATGRHAPGLGGQVERV